MKFHLPLVLLGAALLTAPAVLGQATSGVMGFSTLNCPTGTTLVVPTLVNPSVFQGQAAISADGLTITPTTAPGWAAGAYNATSFSAPTPNYPRFYAEVVSGTNEGLILDVLSNSASVLTMASAVTPAGIRGTTVQIAIREHVTLDKIVQGATGLTAYADAANLFGPTGATITRIFDGSSWVAGDYTTPAGHSVIYPGSGFSFSAASTVVFSFMGEVKPTKTKVPMYQAGVNIVGNLNPASALLIYGSSFKDALSPYADGFNRFSADGNMTTLGTYFSDGAQMLDGAYNPLAPTATDSVPVNRGVVVSVSADAVVTLNSPLAP